MDECRKDIHVDSICQIQTGERDGIYRTNDPIKKKKNENDRLRETETENQRDREREGGKAYRLK